MERAVYQVSEDEGSVEVCAVIRSPPGVECPVDFSVSVTITTSDETAGIYFIKCIVALVHIYIINTCHNMLNTTANCLSLWHQSFVFFKN